MKIINPTGSDISVVVGGLPYTVKKGSYITGVKREHAIYWQTKLHGFLIVKEEVTDEVEEAPVAPVAEVPVEEIPVAVTPAQDVDKPVEESVEEAPKSKTKKGNK